MAEKDEAASEKQPDIRTSMCRICASNCPILVTVEHGRAVKVAGDRSAPMFEGYTCPKGRALPEQHNGPARLLHSLKRHPNGSHAPIASARALDEIAAKVQTILDTYGPRSVALYYGTGILNFLPTLSVALGWMKAIGSPMAFSVSTIDKPGAHIAQAAHGYWPAGHPPFDTAQAWMVIGLNPLISKSGGFPPNNPGRRLKEAVESGRMRLIVIDPRRTETAQRAHIHLQARPGQDPAILAAMIHVILKEALHDHEFVAQEVTGIDALRRAVGPFTPEFVARQADVPAGMIIEAARLFAASRYAGVGCGVGPSFALTGSLTEYLSLALMTICGFWSRAGDEVTRPNVFLPSYEPRAQAMPPFPIRPDGPKLRVRGLGFSAAGMPTAALADEILLPGEGQIKALFCLGGNPMMAWPDQARTARALQSLELLVCADPEMSATARLSDYVIAPKLGLEMPATSVVAEAAKYLGHLRGIEGPFGHYAPAAVDPPEGSDLLADWELYYGLAQRMGLPISMTSHFGIGPHVEATEQVDELDMVNTPSDEDLLAIYSRRSRVPLDMVKAHPHGHIFDEARCTVLPKRPSHPARLDVGNGDMMAELARHAVVSGEASTRFPFTLISRRSNRLMNSAGHSNRLLGGLEPTNPAYFHSSDLTALDIQARDRVRLSSAHGSVVAIAAVDDGLRPKCVSMTHCFGLNPDEEENPETTGCNIGRLLSADAEYDIVTGIPRMGAVPVAVELARRDDEGGPRQTTAAL